MLGSMIGIQVGGTTVGTRTLTISVPAISAVADFIAPAVPSGSSVMVPHISATGELKVPTIAFVIRVPSIDVEADFVAPATPGGSNVFVPPIEVSADFVAPGFTFIVPGRPGLIANRDGTTVDIVISDRDGKQVAIWRADEQFLNFEQIEVVNSDTHEDTGLTLGLNYKYKIQFVSTVGGVVTARGQMTGSKYTRNE